MIGTNVLENEVVRHFSNLTARECWDNIQNIKIYLVIFFFFFFFNENECKKGRASKMQPLWISKDPKHYQRDGKVDQVRGW